MEDIYLFGGGVNCYVIYSIVKIEIMLLEERYLSYENFSFCYIFF